MEKARLSPVTRAPLSLPLFGNWTRAGSARPSPHELRQALCGGVPVHAVLAPARPQNAYHRQQSVAARKVYRQSQRTARKDSDPVLRPAGIQFLQPAFQSIVGQHRILFLPVFRPMPADPPGQTPRKTPDHHGGGDKKKKMHSCRVHTPPVGPFAPRVPAPKPRRPTGQNIRAPVPSCP